MLISKSIERVNQCLEISESMNLTNQEEEALTVELVHHFQKILSVILTKAERDQFKKKIKTLNQFTQLDALRHYVNNHTKPTQWMSILSLQSNALLRLLPSNDYTKKQILKDLSRLFPMKQPIKGDHFFSIEYPETHNTTEIETYFTNLSDFIQHHSITHVVLDSRSFLNLGVAPIINHVESLAYQCKNIMIDITKNEHFTDSMAVVEHIVRHGECQTFGLSVRLSYKKTIKHIHNFISSLNDTDTKRFILRVKKDPYKPNTTSQNVELNAHPVKLNAYYKWSIYTIFNLCRKKNMRCIIQSNQLYDIAWSLILRAQMNLEGRVQYETNLTKSPKIAKLIYIINQAAIHSESILLTHESKTKLQLILTKLTHQSHILNVQNRLKLNQQTIFKKSHHRFFNFLKRNYLEKYLKSIED